MQSELKTQNMNKNCLRACAQDNAPKQFRALKKNCPRCKLHVLPVSGILFPKSILLVQQWWYAKICATQLTMQLESNHAKRKTFQTKIPPNKIVIQFGKPKPACNTKHSRKKRNNIATGKPLVVWHGLKTMVSEEASIHLSISNSTFLAIYVCFFLSYLSIHLSFFLSMYLPIYLSICPSIVFSIFLSLYLSIYLSVCLSFYLPICLSIYLSIYLSSSPSIDPSIYLSIYLSTYLSIYLI